MESISYIGLDVHKKSVAYYIKDVTGRAVSQGKVKAERRALHQVLMDLPGPWVGAMEATMFTGWIYDFLRPYAVELKVAHPAMLKAITAAKKKNDVPTPRSLPTSSGLTCCRNALRCRKSCGSCEEFYAIGTWLFAPLPS